MTVGSAAVLSLQVGKPETRTYAGKEWSTGLFKQPVQNPVGLTVTGFEGDGQADLVHHGGPDKAVCVYSSAHYPYWTEALASELAKGAFGENLTVEGLTEEDVRIGDIYRVGGATVQVSQPRQPCYKLGYRYGRADMPLLVQNTGYTGWYFRVLEEGAVGQGDALVLVSASPYGITVSEANRIMYREKDNRDAILKLLGVPELSDSWRQTLQNRLDASESE